MKVLLASDGSAFSEEAAWILAHLPHTEKLKLTVLTVLSPPITEFYPPTKEFMREIVEEDRKRAEQHQAKLAEMFQGANVDLECQITEGHTEETIIQTAEQAGVDLIVLGARGHSQIDRILLGSTSDYVATHAHCSVWVVRPTGLRDQPQRPFKVMLAYDGSAAAQSALEELTRFHWGPHSEITLCAVVGYNPVFNPDYGFNPEMLYRQAEEALQEARSRLQTKIPNVQEHVIQHEHVAEGLVEYAESAKMDVIVVGDTGRSAIARALLGSVSRYVLRHAHCGVWISRNKDQNA